MVKINPVFKMIFITAFVISVTLLLPQFRNAELSNAALAARDSLFQEYTIRASNSVQVSMELSAVVQRMTEDLFKDADDLKQQGFIIKRNLINISHNTSTKGVSVSRCVDSLGIQEAIKKLDGDINLASMCYLDEANKGASLETSLTKSVNIFRKKMMSGRKSMEKCQTGDRISPTCVTAIRQGVQNSGDRLDLILQTMKEKALLLDDKIDRRKATCRRIASLSIKRISNLIKKIKAC